MKSAPLALVLFLLLHTACNKSCGPDKLALLEHSQALHQEVKNNTNIQNWKQYDKNIERLVNQCYPQFEQELSLKEKIQFWNHIIKYFKLRYQNELQDLIKQGSNLALQKAIEELKKQPINLGDLLELGIDLLN